MQQSTELKNYTTFRVGGSPDTFFHFVKASEYEAALGDLDEHRVIGGGSNLLVADSGVDGTVVALTSDQSAIVDIDRTDVIIDAGGNWHETVVAIAAAGLGGPESLIGIPGTVGGAIVQNIGAYGFEICSFIRHVFAYDKLEKRKVTIEVSDCGFSYRDSRFKSTDRGRFVILGACLRLQKTSRHTPKYRELREQLSQASPSSSEDFDIALVHEHVLALRHGKNMVWSQQDSGTWGAGSFFVNPIVDVAVHTSICATDPERKVPSWPASGSKVKLSAGWLVEQAGFTRGHNWEKVGLANGHALGLVNRSQQAQAADVIAAANNIGKAVHESFGIRLLAEPILLGFDKNMPLSFDAHIE